MDLNFNQIEVNLRNYYFVLSFLVTIYYWVKIIFIPNTTLPKIGYLGVGLINFILTIQLIGRWVNSGHFPLSGLYESLLFLAWGVSFIYLFIENFIKNEFIGLIISPFLLCLLTFTEFSLPTDLQITQPLVPALQSNWLFMHVSVMIISYASLLIGSLISIIYLALNTKQTANSISDSLLVFDNLSYRTIGIGFCFLTLGILSGAVWANETWGTYWSWDPKETWALITWLTFAIYLHTRLLYGWDGKKSAILGSCGFVLIWVCYLGVNLLGKGLHTYGFLSA
jgi:cytochrome c-type biogenesis protein CcsB